MNIKILVCYHKKDFLFKNDILVPIHCGRAIAKQKHKDGQISNDDYNWLINNMIGDDTGDNISKLNREVNEMTAIYWAWKNYDKLGNPDYIGLCHYRRLFNFKGARCFFNQTQIISKSGQKGKVIEKILKNYDFITRSPFFCHDLILKNMESFQDIVNFSKTNRPELYESMQWMKKNKKYYCNNMFVMSRDDFFAYCQYIFSIMFGFLSIENRGELFVKSTQKRVDKKTLEQFDGGNVWVPRITGFLMEYITGFYLLHMMKTKTHAEIDVINTEECLCSWKQIFSPQRLFSVNRKKINGVQYRVIYLLGFMIKIKRIKNA